MSATTSSCETSLTPPANETIERYSSGKGYVLYIIPFKGRVGVEIDKHNIKTFFESELDYELDVHEDVKTCDELWEIIRKAKEKADGDKEVQYKSFFLIISSHGKGITLKDSKGKDVLDYEKRPIIVAEAIQLLDGTCVRVDKIVSKFNHFMTGKPKIFIFQACRNIPNKEDFPDLQDYSYYTAIPKIENMLFFYSATEGIRSTRRLNVGAWIFHDMFVTVKDRYKTEHLVDVLTRVNSLSRNRNRPGHCPQTPTFTSTLTKRFYLQ